MTELMPVLRRDLPPAPDGWYYYRDINGEWIGITPSGEYWFLRTIVAERIVLRRDGCLPGGIGTGWRKAIYKRARELGFPA